MKKLSFFLLIIMALALASCGDSNPVLTIEGGSITGVQTPTEGVIAFKGIPFAAPPVGDSALEGTAAGGALGWCKGGRHLW